MPDKMFQMKIRPTVFLSVKRCRLHGKSLISWYEMKQGSSKNLKQNTHQVYKASHSRWKRPPQCLPC